VSEGILQRSFGLDGRVALVTGARHGIGEGIALALAGAGAAVAVTSRAAEAVEPVATRIREHGVEAAALALEMTDPDSIEAAVAATVERLGRLDILVNNAAISAHGDSADFPVEEWDRILATNLRGAFIACQAAAPRMQDGGGGAIVNLSSPFARVGAVRRAAYSASKAGLEQLTRSLAVEWAPLGIRVNAVAPTTVITESRREYFRDPAVLEARLAAIPSGRLAEVDDVTAAILLLAGRGGAMITGQTILVDGGYSIARG
jgi:2-deoxy-D-gluconate 3-dehydrogenase